MLRDVREEAGAERAVVSSRIGEVKELSIEGGKLNLLRSTFDTNLGLKALIGDRKGTASVNRLEEFLGYVRDTYPHTILEKSILKFSTGESWFLNSNGVEFSTKRGHYDFGAMFSTKKDGKSSSFNFSGYSTDALDEPLWQKGTVEELIRQSAEQLDAKPIPGKFVGDIIVTPDALMSFLGFLTQSVSDFPLITGTSAYKDKLGKPVASDRLTIQAAPLSDQIVEKYFVTGDGYPAENCTVVEKGILKTFLLSLYGESLLPWIQFSGITASSK